MRTAIDETDWNCWPFCFCVDLPHWIDSDLKPAREIPRRSFLLLNKTETFFQRFINGIELAGGAAVTDCCNYL